LLKLVGTLYAALIIFVLIVLVPVALIARINILKFCRTVKDPALIAFSTTSSDAALALGQGKPMSAAGRAMKAALPAATQSRAWSKVGATLRGWREAAGMTIDEVGSAINLKDPAVIEAAENGRVALSFELILRLAAVLGRNDPVGFIMQLTRDSNPEVWRGLDKIGIGKLLVHSAREREFANIYRADDEARSLSDEEFVEVLAFTQAAFAMAMQFRARSEAG